MAYEGFFRFNDVELINLARTAQLADAMNISTVWLRAADYQWIYDAVGEGTYSDITDAPWYDANYPASTEFAGIIPLEVRGLDDSSTESSPIEYITAGGHSGKPRNATLPLVWNANIVASTERGAEFGKRWLDRVLHESASRVFCSGADLLYFRTPSEDGEIVHRRDVRLTRGTSITRKRSGACSAMWGVTWTMTAADPYEYGEPQWRLSGLGSSEVDGLGPGETLENGSAVMMEEGCPVFDYTPIYDPLYPALVPPPTAPEFLPEGWNIFPGDTFERFWFRTTSVDPSDLLVVPMVTLTTTEDARMVRFSIFDGDSDPALDQCGALWSVVVSYLPADMPFTIDGEQKACYVLDAFNSSLRRTDSLAYSSDAGPVQWTAFSHPTSFLVTLDIFTDSDGYEGGGNVIADLSLVPKSD